MWLRANWRWQKNYFKTINRNTLLIERVRKKQCRIESGCTSLQWIATIAPHVEDSYRLHASLAKGRIFAKQNWNTCCWWWFKRRYLEHYKAMVWQNCIRQKYQRTGFPTEIKQRQRYGGEKRDALRKRGIYPYGRCRWCYWFQWDR